MGYMEQKLIFQLFAAGIGGTVGYIYYKLVGCKSGTCPLTSTPGGSIFMGAISGFLAAGSMFLR